MDRQQAEVAAGERFEFGANWSAFLNRLTPQRVQSAEKSLQNMLTVRDLASKRFLDAGSGSGLFSLAAYQLGASVHSFDYDPKSVACTEELRRRYGSDGGRWVVERGSVLDSSYLARLGCFDVVYSWGVLHHTGAMWDALNNVIALVADGGTLFIAIYNDQGSWSRRWLAIKKLYNHLPSPFRQLYLYGVVGVRELRYLAGATLRGRPWQHISAVLNYGERNLRGMNYWHDMVDWIGGYPFEVAKPEEIFRFCRDRGLILKNLKTCGGGHGCNEFLFTKPG